MRFDSIITYALLNGIWVNLSTDVLTREEVNARIGIFGYSPTSIIADVGELKFSLKNPTDKYNPDGASPLAGWGTGITIKQVFVYGGVPYNRFQGHIPKDGIQLIPGKPNTTSYVDVTVLGWMKYATDTPIISPSIEEDKTADQALETLIDIVPFPISTNFDTGTYTFPTVFDGTGKYTTAYSEFSRLAFSESPGRIYTRIQQGGEVLVFENSAHRDTPTQKNTYTQTLNYFKNHASGKWKNHSGGYFINHSPTQTNATAVSFSTDIDAADILHGENIINNATVTAYPKRIDKDLQILYQLPFPVPLASGETKRITGQYVDPNGGGTRINAIVSSMQTPAVPGGADPTLMCLLNFRDTTFTDETGRHTVSQYDSVRWDDAYEDGFGTGLLTSGVLGTYTIFGGVSDDKVTMPSSPDFDLFDGTTPCTIGFYAAIFNATSGQALITRDMTAAIYSPYLLGYTTGIGGTIRIYMSSNGSSWNVAADQSWGTLVKNKWIWFEIGYEDGWFYAFNDGKRTAKWYSATPIPPSSGTFSIGKTQNTIYQWFSIDSFFIRKGVCLHKTDFDPPRKEISATLEGDYQLNTADDDSGTDLSSSLSITATYSADKPVYDLYQNSGSDGYITFLQARGRGLYNYDDITENVQDAASIASEGFKNLDIDQYYQQDLTAGLAWITSIVTDNADARTVLRSISFWANKTELNMLRFLQCNIGDLIRVVMSNQNIDRYYHIQNIGYSIQSGLNVYVTFGLVEGNTP